MKILNRFSIPSVLAGILSLTMTFGGAIHAQGQQNSNKGSSGKIYVTNQASDDVTVISYPSFEVITTLKVEDRPHNVNHTPDGKFVLVTNKNINVNAAPSLTIIRSIDDQIDGTVRNIGSRIEHVVSPANNRAYVSEDLGENAIVEINLDTQAIASKASVGIKPHGLWPTPDGKFIFAPNQLSGTISKVNIETMSVIAETNVGLTPTMVAVSPDGQFAYVSLFGERGLAVLDANKVESSRMQVNDVIPIGERPAQVAVTPDNKYVLIPCEGPGALYVVSTSDHKIVRIIPTGKKAHGVDVSSDSRYAFVSNWGDNTVSVIDLERLVVIKEVPVGEEPAGIDFVPINL